MSFAGWHQINQKYAKRLTDGNRWAFLHIVVAESAVNYKVRINSIDDTCPEGRLLLSYTPRYARALSLLAIRGLGRNFDYGGILRVWLEIA